MPQVDESLPEWRIIVVLLPLLFQTDLHWRIKPDSSPKDRPPPRLLSKLLSWFRWIRPQQCIPDSEDNPILTQLRTRMEELIKRQPIGELQDHVLRNCQCALSELLSVLEEFVDDSAIEVSRDSSQEDESQVELETSPLRAQQSPDHVSVIQATTQGSWPWGIDTDSGLSRAPPTALATSSNASLQQKVSRELLAASPGIPYRKLQSLISVFENDADRFSTFVRLNNTVGQYEQLLKKVQVAEACFKGAMGDKLRQCAPATGLQQEFPVTNWKDATPWIASCQLFLNISRTMCSGHHVRVHLNGFSLESQDEQVPFKVFVSSCPPTLSASWIQLRCKYFTRLVCLVLHNTYPLSATDDDNRGFTDPDDQNPVMDLCSLHASEARVSVPNVIDMEFGEGRFYKQLTTHPTTHSETPTVSLAYLLENGFLNTPFNGGVFNLLDKAALALSLARCLLHYFQGHLMEQAWTADNIHFLHQYKGTEQWLFNIHHPYVTCRTIGDAQDLLWHRKGDLKQPRSDSLHEIRVDPAVCRVFLWYFARLLLEIEMGQRITLTAPFEDADAVYAELEGINKGVPGNRVLYKQAVRGCITFTEHFRHTKRADQTLYDVRSVLYKEVVRHLEQHIQFFHDPSVYNEPRHVQLKRSIDSMNSFPSHCTVILQRQGDASQVTRKALLDTGADENCITENLCTILKCVRSSYTGRPFIQVDESIIAPKEKVVVEFSIGEVGRKQEGQFLVVEKLAGVDILLGRPFFEQSKTLQYTGDYL
ncbi:hypothetical protein PG991_003015 [Apiospora marii]|uniref:Peptidase A2 domain-containing protein n=1 Tax=Apiospora marii TaxID=335849 RepID=A0ABR1SH18_9PEZI